MKRNILPVIAIVAIVMVLCTIFGIGLSSYGNENWGFDNHTYTHARVSDGIEAYCVTFDKWHNAGIGVELHAEEFGSIYCAEGTYFLFKDAGECPFCEE